MEAYNHEKKNLHHLRRLHHRVSKAQQLSNWEAAELSDAQLRYAAIDAWSCREMYIKLTANE